MWPDLPGRTSNDSEFHAESNESFRSQIQCVLFGEIDLMPLLKQTSPVCAQEIRIFDTRKHFSC